MTKRHSQTLVDAASGKRFHWDGEFDSVADLVEARLGTPSGARARHAKPTADPAGTTPVPLPPAPPPAGPPVPPAPPPSTPPAAPPDTDPASEPDDPPPVAVPLYGPANPCTPYDRPVGGIPAGLRRPKDAKHADSGSHHSSGGGPAYHAPSSSTSTPGEGGNAEGAGAPASGEPSASASTPDASASGPSYPSEGGSAGASPSQGSGTSTASAGTASSGAAQSGAGSGTGTTGSAAEGSHASGTSWSGAGAASAAGTGSSPTAAAAGAPEGGTAAGSPDKKGPTSSTKVEDHAHSVAARVEKDGRYDEAFDAAFGSHEVSTARIAKAIGAFVESIRSTESPFDRYVAGDKDALSESARRGLALFEGRAGCNQCHLTSSQGANAGHGAAARGAPFTDHEFHDTGIPARSAAKRAVTPVTADSLPYDDGREIMSKAHADRGSFKTPTLRDVALRAPFMHDGSLATLTQVVRHYARGGFRDERLDPLVRKFDATSGDVADLVAFLESLTGDVRPALAPDDGLRARPTRLRIVDAGGRPIAGLPVELDPAGDSLPGDIPILSRSWSLETDEQGRVAYVPARRTHMRLSVPRGIGAPAQGGWIPDTCRELTVTLPVAGKATLLLSLPEGTTVAKGLVANTELTALTDAGRSMLAMYAPETLAALRRKAATFALEGVVDLDLRTYARYSAWIPAGAPESAFVEVPLPSRTTSHRVSLVPGKETRVDIPR